MVQFTRRPFAKKKPEAAPPQQPKTEDVAKLAYALYLNRGGEHGKDQEDWLQAEALLRQRRN